MVNIVDEEGRVIFTRISMSRNVQRAAERQVVSGFLQVSQNPGPIFPTSFILKFYVKRTTL